MKCSLGSSHFLEEISSLSHSVLFLYFFALITEEGFLISYSILWNSEFRCLYLSFSPLLFASLLFTAIFKASPDIHLAFLHFFPMGMVLIPVSQRWRNSIQSTKTRPEADCGSDHDLLIIKFRLKLEKVGKTTRPFRYDPNQIPYNYTVKVRNR